MLDAVDARLDQRGQHRLAEAVGGDAGAVLVRGRDRGGERLVGEGRRQVARLARDPVADELHPAVARLRLLGDVGRQVGGLDLVGVVADVAAGAREVAAAADQAGQVVTVVHPAGVGRRAAVAQEQRAGVAVGDGLLLGGGVVDGAVGVEAEVAVGVDEAGHDPALGRGLGSGLPLEGDPAVDDVEVAWLAVGQHGAAESEGGHGSGRYRLLRVVPAPAAARCGESALSGPGG